MVSVLASQGQSFAKATSCSRDGQGGGRARHRARQLEGTLSKSRSCACLLEGLEHGPSAHECPETVRVVAGGSGERALERPGVVVRQGHVSCSQFVNDLLGITVSKFVRADAVGNEPKSAMDLDPVPLCDPRAGSFNNASTIVA
jgi:hypothetical protein